MSGERKGVYPYVMIFGNPDLRINLWFSYSEKDENDFYKKLNIDAVKDARGFLVSVPDKRRKVYLSGVLTYGYISPDTRRGEISRDGILPRLPLTEYGEFFLDNPIALEVISEKESDTILQEIKGLELLSEDKKCIKSPYMFDATPKMYKEFLLFLQGHERISVEEQ